MSHSATPTTATDAALVDLGRRAFEMNSARKRPLSDKTTAQLFGVGEMLLLNAELAYLRTLPTAPAPASYWSVSRRRWVTRTTSAPAATLSAVA